MEETDVDESVVVEEVAAREWWWRAPEAEARFTVSLTTLWEALIQPMYK